MKNLKPEKICEADKVSKTSDPPKQSEKRMSMTNGWNFDHFHIDSIILSPVVKFYMLQYITAQINTRRQKIEILPICCRKFMNFCWFYRTSKTIFDKEYANILIVSAANKNH